MPSPDAAAPAADAELVQMRIELASARARAAALQAELAHSERRLADAAAALRDSEAARSKLEATLPLRFANGVRGMRRAAVETIRRLGRRYVSPQTRNRLVRRYPWLRRKQPLRRRPLPVVAAVEQSAGAGQAPAQAMPDIIVLPLMEWQERLQRMQHLALQFAANGQRVFYVSPVNMPLSSVTTGATLTSLATNVWDVRLPAPRRPLIYREALDAAMVRDMAAACERLRAEKGIGSAVCIVGFPSWAPLAFELRRRFGWRIVYDCVDDWLHAQGVYAAALAPEDELARTCDGIMVLTQRLLDKWQSANARTLLLRNGVDADAFALACRPNETLAHLQHPLIGFAGAVSERLDLALLAAIAAARPSWSFVLAGTPSADTAAVRGLSNVHLIDNPGQTAAAVYHFDVCILPLRSGHASPAEVTRVYEYLSVGKPVVSTPVPELSDEAAYVSTASDASGFVAAIESALCESDPLPARRRRLRAAANAWNQRYMAAADFVTSLYPMASLVVVAYNNVALTQQCLESIYRNTQYPNYEVIVVDNASSDATRPYLAYAESAYPRLRVLTSMANGGFAHACNRGIAAAGGEFIVILNNDVVTPRGWLERLLRHLDDASIGLVGPVTNAAGNEARIDVTYQNLDDMEAFATAHCAEHAGEVFDIGVSALFCAAMRRSLLQQIGPLDEQFAVGLFEDDDLSHRVRRAGLRVVCAEDVFVHHVGEAALKQLAPDDYERIFAANRARFERKWGVAWQPHTGRAAR